MENKASELNAKATKSKKNNTPLLITGLIILALLSAFLGWELSNKSALNTEYKTQIDLLQADLTDMDNMMKQNGLGNMMEDDIKSSLNNLLADYNAVNTNNQELNDSIASQKEKVVFLLSELEDTEKRRKYTAHELYKMKKETETLRKVMKDYVHRIDSLNTLNKELQAEIEVKDNTISEVSTERDKLKTVTEDLNKKVALGSKLQILNLTSGAISIKRTGGFDETSRTRRADQIRACYTIVSNTMTKAGAKVFHMRIVSPANEVLTSNNSTTLSINGEEIKTSISRTIDYQNKNIDLCIFYEKQVDKLAQGNYKIEIYSENILVGTSGFALK
jgi:predicted RNase H-like nuclease (RuvC/YqgF family)